MVCAPVPGILKAIRSGPPTLGLRLASRIACRSEPAPPSLVFSTLKVLRRHRPSSASRTGRLTLRRRSRRAGVRPRRAFTLLAQAFVDMGGDPFQGDGLRWEEKAG